MATGADVLALLEARLAFEVDVMAAREAQLAGEAVLVDTRRRASWEHGHVADALHLPDADEWSALPGDVTLVLYGWGPGCNGATRAARRLLADGVDVREMIGGYEYWVRNGLPVVRHGVPATPRPDPLVTASCGARRRGLAGRSR